MLVVTRCAVWVQLVIVTTAGIRPRQETGQWRHRRHQGGHQFRENFHLALSHILARMSIQCMGVWLVSWWHAQEYIGFNLQWMVDIFWTHGREYWTRSKGGECRILNTKHRSSQLVVSCNISSELQVPPHRTQMAPGITKYIPRWNNQPFLTGGWRGTEPGRRVNQVWRCSVCRMKYSEKAPSAFHWNCCKQASQIQVETTCFHIS